MTYECLLYEVQRGIAMVTLDRPRVLHALSARMFEELDEVFRRIDGDASVRVVLVAGGGEKAFAAGADIQELAARDQSSGAANARLGQNVLSRIESCRVPVIALIQGFALGGGCELALACTLRIASESARFGQPEVKLGLIPGYGGTQRLPRLIGRAKALHLMLTGEIVDANEAHRLGLVNEVVPQSRLHMRGRELAEDIAGMAPLAIAGCLQAVRQGENLTLEQGCHLEADIFGALCGTADKREGAQAFLDRRPPRWVGR